MKFMIECERELKKKLEDMKRNRYIESANW